MEDWKDIQGFDGLYQVSSDGRIRNNKGKILKLFQDGYGYLYVGLHKNGTILTKSAHRLVAEAFLENPNNYEQVNHKDEDKHNNNVDNLEWCTPKYNCNYGSRNEKLSRRVNQIDPQTGEVIHQWASARECGRNGYDAASVSRCALGKYKQHKGYIWKYAPM